MDAIGSQSVDLYLDLVKMSLTGALSEENDLILGGCRGEGSRRQRIANRVADLARSFDIEMVRKRPYDRANRELGLDRPGRARSMIGLRRMDNIRLCVDTVLREGIPGDLIEAGVWRGGAAIFMRAVLKVHGDTSQTVWVADSFAGLPAPDAARYPTMRAAITHTDGVVLGQVDVDVRTNEIPLLPTLLDTNDLDRTVITADALHWQRSHADYLVHQRRAHYLLTVKGNQPALHTQLAGLPWADVPTGHTATTQPSPMRVPFSTVALLAIQT